jgi:hypothetical protein
MENKQTVMQKLAIEVEDMIGLSTMADQNKPATVGYQMALVAIKSRLKELLVEEAEQIKNDYLQGIDSILEYRDEEDYYNETYKQQ